MKEREWAERFTWDTDCLLREVQRSEQEPAPAWYQETLELARELCSLDLSAESRKRETLRQMFAGGTVTPQPEKAHRERGVLRLFWRRHPAWVISSGLACMLLLAALVIPGVKTTAAEIIKYVQKLVLGEHLTAIQLSEEYAESRRQNYKGPRFSREDLLSGPQVIIEGDSWMFLSVGGMGSGYIPPGAKPMLREFDTIRDAQRAATFPLRLPAYMTPEHDFRIAIVTPDRQAYLFYGEPAHEIMVSQSRVGDGKTTMALATNGPMEEVTVNGVRAVWMGETPGGVLSWESDGTIYSVSAAEEYQSEAIRIAESLR